MKEPIFLNPIFKDYIWGGKRLKEKFNKNTPYDITAESWEVSANGNGESIIKNGEFEGMKLSELFGKDEIKAQIFGTKSIDMEKFPLLIKFIDAESNLSVQVHPDNKYAFEKENGSQGKDEMWYIMDCKEGAQIIYGMKENVEPKDLSAILQSENISEYLNFVDVNKGDCIYIPSGTIHAILGDTLICEVQQNSDLTYRVYDWGRVGKDGKPRELHVQKAIDVVKLDNENSINNTNNIQEGNENIISSNFFKTDKVVVKSGFIDTSSQETFYAYNVVDGNGKIIVNDKEYELSLGDSFIIPANLGEYKISGQIELLKSYI